MDIVLLEGLGVSDQVLERHSRRLEGLGHVLTVYEKNTDPKVQEERCRDADVVMLANMPLALSAVEKNFSMLLLRGPLTRMSKRFSCR